MKKEELCFYDGVTLLIDDENCSNYLLTNYQDFKLKKTTDYANVDPIITYEGVYKNFRIIMEPNGEKFLVKLKGSLHKLFFEGKNHEDFTKSNFLTVSEILINEFQFNPNLAKVITLEYGVNIIAPYYWKSNPRDIISNIVFLSKKNKKGRKNKSEYEDEGIARIARHNEHLLKAYFKSAHSGKEYEHLNILRFERCFTKKRPLNKMGIFTFQDLLTKNYNDKLNKFLIKSFSEMKIYQPDIENSEKISDDDKFFFVQHRAEDVWQEARKNSKLFKQKADRFESIIDRYGEENYRKYILEKMKEKIYQ